MLEKIIIFILNVIISSLFIILFGLFLLGIFSLGWSFTTLDSAPIQKLYNLYSKSFTEDLGIMLRGGSVLGFITAIAMEFDSDENSKE